MRDVGRGGLLRGYIYPWELNGWEANVSELLHVYKQGRNEL